MSKIALYQTSPSVKELVSRQTDIEKRLQTLIEEHMETFFGVRFLATEYTTTNGGRIDSLGLDENNLPVIFEYKRSISENVINQGLFIDDGGCIEKKCWENNYPLHPFMWSCFVLSS